MGNIPKLGPNPLLLKPQRGAMTGPKSDFFVSSTLPNVFVHTLLPGTLLKDGTIFITPIL